MIPTEDIARQSVSLKVCIVFGERELRSWLSPLEEKQILVPCQAVSLMS